MKKLVIAAVLAFGCSEQSDTTNVEQTDPSIGQAEQEIGLKPAKKGCYREPGIFRAADGSEQPFSAYVCWLPPDNNFVVVGSFGSLETDLSLPDVTTELDPVTGFPTNPKQPFLYEYAEDADCSFGLLTTDCVADEQVYFSFVPGSAPFISQGLTWSISRAAGAPDSSPFFAQPDYVFSSVAEAGEGVDAFNYRIKGAECEEAVDRMATFFAARSVVFDEIELDAEDICD